MKSIDLLIFSAMKISDSILINELQCRSYNDNTNLLFQKIVHINIKKI